MYLTPIKLVNKQIDINTGGFFYAAKAITNQKHVEKTEKRAQTIFAKMGRKYIDHPGVMGLTALHVAVIAGKPLAVKLFLRLGARLSVQDSRGWTPMHHAAMQEDDAILRMLLGEDSDGVAGRVKNKYGGTWEELRQLAFPGSQKPADDAIVFHYENDAGEIVEGTTGDFERLTGAKFAYQMFSSPKFLQEEWGNPPERHPPYSGIEQGHHELLESLPQLYMKKVEGAGWGLFANEEIPQGKLIVTYFGEAIHDSEKYEYQLGDVDAEKVRNLGAMVNDGFPNSVIVGIHDVKGISDLKSFLATSAIKKGDQILFNYGIDHPIRKKLYNFLPSREIVESFYTQEKIDQHIADCIKATTHYERANAFVPLEYLISTPKLLIMLAIKGQIDLGVLKRFVENNLVRLFGDNNPFFTTVAACEGVMQCLENQIKQTKKPTRTKEQLIEFMETVFRELPMNPASNALIEFSEASVPKCFCHDDVMRKFPANLIELFELKIMIYGSSVRGEEFLKRRKYTLNQELFLASGETALRRAAALGNLSDVKFLVKKAGADPNAKGASSRKTALDFARARNHLSVVQFLENK